MIRSKSIDVTVAANGEQYEDFVTGESGKEKRVRELWFEQLAGTNLRAYVHQDMLVDVAAEVNQADVLGVPVDRVLAVGETFKAGFKDVTAGGGTAWVTVFWDEVG